jgi:2,3,4,5-tetrahydropyridine-2,6-dicarboxylate N-succinyltransferase
VTPVDLADLPGAPLDRARLDDAYARRDQLTPAEAADLAPVVEAGLVDLDAGRLRAAWPVGDDWVVDTGVKKLILLSFHLRSSVVARGGPDRPVSYDKVPLKFEHWTDEDFARARIRVVPGAVVRRGAYLGPGAVLMPSMVNIGAHVGPETMVDTWATVGSCAQVGRRCHIAGGAGIGGVLEPVGEEPVVIEDDVFVGARSEVAEGVRVRRGAVLSMGVYLGRSTPIIDRATGEVHRGEVPPDAVVVPGSRLDAVDPGLATYAAVIVKYADAGTRAKLNLDDVFRAPR